ncbi:MAG: hypothetical protein PVF13_02950 [Chromatiales bacterium]|jgi:hypothetical protein
MSQDLENNIPVQIEPAEGPANIGADAAVTAMGAAMANREAILKSLAERREQVFKLLEAQREEALKPMLQARELLQQAHASIGKTAHSAPALNHRDSNNGGKSMPVDSRQRLVHALINGLTVLLSLLGAGGAAAEASRDQAVSEITDAFIALIEAEVDKHLRG